MGKRGVKITAIVIAAVFLLGIIGPLIYSMAFSEPVDKIKELQEKITQTEQRIAELDAEMAAAETLENEKLSESGKRLRVMCEKGLTSYIDIIFSAENLSDFADRIVIARELMEYDRNITGAIKAIKNEISAKKAEVEELLLQQRAAEAELLALEENK